MKKLSMKKAGNSYKQSQTTNFSNYFIIIYINITILELKYNNCRRFYCIVIIVSNFVGVEPVTVAWLVSGKKI